MFVLVDVGRGHLSPAVAVSEQLERSEAGRFETRLVDVLHELGLGMLDRSVKRSWSEFFLRFPPFFDILYGAGDAFSRIMVNGVALIVGPQLRRLERYCRRLRPDLLVATHFIAINALAILRQRGRLAVPVIGMVVDPFECNKVMGHVGLDGLVTFSRRSLAAYRRQLPSVEVTRFPFPLSARFRADGTSRRETRRRLGLPPDRFVLLMTAGADGAGNFRRYFERLSRAGLDLHLVVVCGRNVRLRAELETWRPHAAGRTILGFVDNMHDLISACDVVLGAGGANLTMEALSVGRPLILTLSTANIRGTIAYVVRSGFGWWCPKAAGIVPLVRRLLEEPGIVREAGRRISEAGIRSGSPELAAYLAAKAAPTRTGATRPGS